MSKAPKISDEAKFLIVIMLLILSIPLLFYLLQRGETTQESAPKPESVEEKKKALTVLVSEAEKKSSAAPIPAKAAVEKIRESIKQGSYSTAHLQLARVAKGSPEYQELLKEMIAANQTRSGLKQIAPGPKTPLRYVDASTPRTRQEEAMFLYLADDGEAPSPWFCIQTYQNRHLGITGFRFKADGKLLTIKVPASSTQKRGNWYAEYYDAPLTREGYAVIKGVVAAHQAEVVYLDSQKNGSSKKSGRLITDQEKKAMVRILELYEGLGGSMAPFEATH